MVKKKAEPPLTLKPPMVEDCSDCNGAGKTKPMIYELPCFTCGGAGLVEESTKRILECHEAYLALHERDQRKDALIRHLKRQRPENEHDPHAPVTTRHSGKVRLD